MATLSLIVAMFLKPLSQGLNVSPNIRGGLAPRATKALVAETSEASLGSLESLKELSRNSATTTEDFAAAILNLDSAVDAVRALDLNPDLVTGAAFASTLEVIASRAPNAAAGALVGHAMTRLKKREDGSSMCMQDEILAPLAASLLKARKDKEALLAVESLRSPRRGRDYRVGIIAASRLNDPAKIKATVQEAILEMKRHAASNRTAETFGLDEATLKFAMKVLAKSGDYRTPFAIVDALPRDRRTPALYHAAIAACGKTRPHPKGKTAMLLWKRMKTDGFRDSIPRSTYNVRCGDLAFARDLLQLVDIASVVLMVSTTERLAFPHLSFLSTTERRRFCTVPRGPSTMQKAITPMPTRRRLFSPKWRREASASMWSVTISL